MKQLFKFIVLSFVALSISQSVSAHTFFFHTLAQPGATPTGYFVLSGATYSGFLSGLSGADSSCLSELGSNDWLGKANAGTLTSARVKAFLCDTATCNGLLPNTTYRFARMGMPAVGGSSFTTDGTGLGPNDGVSWSDPTRFSGSVSFYSGRLAGTSTAWSNSPDSTINQCSNWTANTGTTATVGTTSAVDQNRWSSTTAQSCGASTYLICLVHP